jgi:hypothetical protein
VIDDVDDAGDARSSSFKGHSRARKGYGEAGARAVIDRIAAGDLLSRVCAEPEMPTRKQFCGWMEHRPELKSAYLMARLSWAEFWAEKALQIALDGPKDIFIDGAGKAMLDHANVQRARLQCDQIKWMTSKYA